MVNVSLSLQKYEVLHIALHTIIMKQYILFTPGASFTRKF